jgi:glycine betaine/proline transport system permease protein
VFVALSFLFLGFIDHLDVAMQTLAIIFVCTGLSVILGVPIGIAMSKSDTMQRASIPVLDLLQTLPSFVYLIPLIFLFSVTESKLYGIAIILYAIVPIIRLTDLGIRLVDRDVIEAADAFGMTNRQKLIKVQLPLATAQHYGRGEPDHYDEPCDGCYCVTCVCAWPWCACAARYP